MAVKLLDPVISEALVAIDCQLAERMRLNPAIAADIISGPTSGSLQQSTSVMLPTIPTAQPQYFSSPGEDLALGRVGHIALPVRRDEAQRLQQTRHLAEVLIGLGAPALQSVPIQGSSPQV